MVEAAVGLGVILSLLFSELLGASAGGIVVPGYIAMYLHRPTLIIGTIAVSLATLIIIKIISNFSLLYGKRRMVLSILIGFILGWATRNIIFVNITIYDLKMQSIGYIIPGLIANWMERQGIFRTLFTMIIAAVLVRLILIVISGGEVMFDV
ncbi:MAG: poly-gamma-glutamate biosynthesis protein PgsC [Candidatus Cloacimonetes bacterium]|nr:poly-gamma-glutamate biosynthesis protein PgsC [Candidatus Cloacimonadota bacterium]